MSRAAFEARFPDEAACARHLAAMRWPDGFVCPACGHDRGFEASPGELGMCGLREGDLGVQARSCTAATCP